jgi:hypothetical protein
VVEANASVLPTEVVHDLHGDVLGRPGDHQARTLGGAVIRLRPRA